MSATVFIIDDDNSIRRSLSLLLSAHDYVVETFSSSEEFLEREMEKLSLGNSQIEHCVFRRSIVDLECQNDGLMEGDDWLFESKGDL